MVSKSEEGVNLDASGSLFLYLEEEEKEPPIPGYNLYIYAEKLSGYVQYKDDYIIPVYTAEELLILGERTLIPQKVSEEFDNSICPRVTAGNNTVDMKPNYPSVMQDEMDENLMNGLDLSLENQKYPLNKQRSTYTTEELIPEVDLTMPNSALKQPENDVCGMIAIVNDAAEMEDDIVFRIAREIDDHSRNGLDSSLELEENHMIATKLEYSEQKNDSSLENISNTNDTFLLSSDVDETYKAGETDYSMRIRLDDEHAEEYRNDNHLIIAKQIEESTIDNLSIVSSYDSEFEVSYTQEHHKFDFEEILVPEQQMHTLDEYNLSDMIEQVTCYYEGDDLEGNENQEKSDIADMLINLLNDHFLEPVEAWWKDGWSKYLRQYIRDMKYLFKGTGNLLKMKVTQLLEIGTTFSLAAYERLFNLDELLYNMPSYTMTSVQDVPSQAGITLSLFYNSIKTATYEICSSTGSVRLSIRNFMHDKDFRFNYFWYCFYTILYVFSLMLMMYILKKMFTFCNQILFFNLSVLRMIFGRTTKVDMAVGTEPVDFSIISVDIDVLRQLEKNLDTEQERLDRISELEEQLRYAGQMTQWSTEKIEGLNTEIQRLGLGEQDELAENMQMPAASQNSTIPAPADEPES